MRCVRNVAKQGRISFCVGGEAVYKASCAKLLKHVLFLFLPILAEETVGYKDGIGSLFAVGEPRIRSMYAKRGNVL